MLNQFTWQDFIAAALMLGLTYYALASILLFHKEIIAFFKGKPAQSAYPDHAPAPAVATLQAEAGSALAPVATHTATPRTTEQSLPGTEERDEEVANMETNTHGYSGEELPDEQHLAQEIVVDDESENPHGSNATLIIGTVSDLLSEMKSLFLVCAENKTARLEVLRFIRLLLRRYVSLYQSEYKDSITLYIYHTWNEHLSHPIDPTEIAQCWLPSQPQ